MADGVRIGLNAEEKREVMELLGIMGLLKARRWTGWRERVFGDLIPPLENSQCLTPKYSRRSLHPRLFDHDHVEHVEGGYPYVSPSSPPSTLVDLRAHDLSS